MIETPPPPQSARRRRLRGLLRLCGIVLLLLVVGLFFARREIGGILARNLNERLSAAGVFLTWQSADWVPGSGIKVHGLALFRDAARRNRLALLDRVTVHKGDPEWNRWDTMHVNITDARLTLGSGDGETNVERLSMILQIQPGRVDLQECHGSLLGLRIEVKGTFMQTAAPAPSNSAAATKSLSSGKSLFEHVDLDRLKVLKRWVEVKPERDEPVLKLDFRPLPDGGGLDLAASLKGSNFAWHGATWDFVQAAVRTSVWERTSPVAIGQMRITHAGRNADIAGEFDPASAVLRINSLESGIDVLKLARAFVPGASANLAGVSSTGSWRISGKGEFPLDRPAESRWTGPVELNGDLVYATSQIRVALQKPAFTLRMEKLGVSVEALKAGLWAGKLEVPEMRFDLPSQKAKPRFQTQIAISNALLESVMGSFGTPQKQPGTAHFDWRGGGEYDLASFVGTGSLSIHDAEFFRLPLFGSLGRAMDKLTPGFGRDTSTSVTVTHRTGGGVVQVENLILNSQQTRIELDGTIDLKRHHAAFAGEARMKGLVGLLTSPLRTRSAVKGEGPLGDVRWNLERKPGTGFVGGAIKAIGEDKNDDIKKDSGTPARDQPKSPRKLQPHKF